VIINVTVDGSILCIFVAQCLFPNSLSVPTSEEVISASILVYLTVLSASILVYLTVLPGNVAFVLRTLQPVTL
jgi:hypothetical protein